jgi:NADH-quinone oxidoreductase subunit K
MVITFEEQLILAGILFMIGFVGILVRRNILFMLMGLEIMMNSAGLVFIAAGSRFGQPDGQVMFIFIIAVAAAEVSVALALVIQMFNHFKTIDTKSLNTLK